MPQSDVDDGLSLGDCVHGFEQGVIRVSKCEACGSQQAIPAATCFNCGSRARRVADHDGTGTLFSWVVCHYPFDGRWKTLVPYTVVLVELQGGGRVYGRLTEGADPKLLRMGASMALVAPETRAHKTPIFKISEG